jgi:hypothetical protein
MLTQGNGGRLTQGNGGINLTKILTGLLVAYVASPVDLVPGPVDDAALVAILLPVLLLLFAIGAMRGGNAQ